MTEQPTRAPFDVAAFLGEPLRPAQVASVSRSGLPVLGSLWFVYADHRFWFSSRPEAPLPRAMARGAEIAVIVDDFTPPDRIRQVRVRGTGRFEAHDPARVEQIYRRYLGTGLDSWPSIFRDRLRDPAWSLWTVPPGTGLVVCFPQFEAHEVHWRSDEDSPLPADATGPP